VLFRSDIAELMLASVSARAGGKGVAVSCDDGFRELLLSEGFSPKFGARPMRRAVQRLLENPLSECLLDGFAKDGDDVTVTVSTSGGMGVAMQNGRGGVREFSLEELGGGSGGIEADASAAKPGAAAGGTARDEVDLPLPGFAAQ